jgi:glycerophosphoryl diester phosphodiesterase
MGVIAFTRFWPAAPSLHGASTLDELRAHGRSVGHPFALVASPRSVFLRTGSETLGQIPGTDHTVTLLDVEALHRAGSKVIPWTVNTREEMVRLLDVGVDGIISDDPQLLRETVEVYDARHHAGFFSPDGLVDDARLSVQAHRGGRNLRPENTLPAMEVGLDCLASTLETDVCISADGVPLLSHGNHIAAKNARRVDGADYPPERELRVRDLTRSENQAQFVLDKLLPDRPKQRNDLALSPVAVAFAKQAGLSSPYVMPSVDQLFAFTRFYAEYYKSGEGRAHSDAERRWKNAERVRFNVETKVSSSSEIAGDVIAVEPFTRALADSIRRNGMQGRADIQSFDPRSIRIVQQEYRDIRAVYLFED